MSSSPEPVADIRTRMMRLEFVTEEEQRKLVAAWDRVSRRDDTPRAIREWLETAGIDDRFQTRRWAHALRRNGICRDDGTVDTEVAKVLAARAITRVTGAPRRGRPR